VPAIEIAAAQRLDPGVTRRAVSKQDVLRPIGQIVTDANNLIVRIGTAKLVPAIERAIADRLDPDIAARVVAEQNVVSAIAR